MESESQNRPPLAITQGGSDEAAPKNIIEIIGTKRYPPVRQCIYCGATGVRLSDEHIVPFALNGNWILPEASCESCAIITGRLEGQILGGELKHLRAALNFKTRGHCERPKFERLRADDHDVEIPISDCPIVMPIVKFAAPRILNDLPAKDGIDVIGSVGIRWGPEPEEFSKGRGFRKVSFEKTLKPAEFARMIAKIGYSHAVACFGLRSFEKGFVSEVILGKSQRIGDVVGCCQAELPGLQNPDQHVLQVAVYERGATGEDRLVTVRVKLFAGRQTPVYEVTVGKPVLALQLGTTPAS